FIIRKPRGQLGFGGTDTLRGNFWGETGPDIITKLPNTSVLQHTFFIDFYKGGCFDSVYEPNCFPPGPYTAKIIGEIPDTLLMEGRIYDIFDQGTDMKTADYNPRRMAPSEDFA